MYLFKTIKPLNLAACLFFGLATSFFIISCKSEEKKEEITETSTKPVVIGYVGGFHGLLNTERIEAKN
jgi:chitinase